MTFVDLIAGCAEWARPATRETDPDLHIIHRVGEPRGIEWWIGDFRLDSIVDIARAYAEHPELAKAVGSLPYNLAVWPDGRVEQGLPLSAYGPNAVGWSRRAVATAVIADTRHASLTEPQRTALVEVCASVHARCLPHLIGHTDLPGGSRIPGHVCPGGRLDVGDLHIASLRRFYSAGFDPLPLV
jgi:hypothetical protein